MYVYRYSELTIILFSQQNSLPPPLPEIVQSLLKKKHFKKFPDSLQSFATTLHFYSLSAYNFLRDKFLVILPDPNSLRRWHTSVYHNPGISQKALKSVCQMMEMTKKKLYFNLTVDEMAIRKRIEVNANEIHGYVDLGLNDNKQRFTEATNALVFMIVAINGFFKTPVAYYLVNSISGTKKGELLCDILCALHEKNIEVYNITFDGASTNIKMMETLGTNIREDNMVGTILHPIKKKILLLCLMLVIC